MACLTKLNVTGVRTPRYDVSSTKPTPGQKPCPTVLGVVKGWRGIEDSITLYALPAEPPFSFHPNLQELLRLVNQTRKLAMAHFAFDVGQG